MDFDRLRRVAKLAKGCRRIVALAILIHDTLVEFFEDEHTAVMQENS